MESHTRQTRISPIRCIAAVSMLLPVFALCWLQWIATPDLETWLATNAGDAAHPDAFDGLTNLAPPFTALLGMASLFAMSLVLSHKSHYLLPLFIAPLLGLAIYLITHGMVDPNWHTLFALPGIFVLASLPVTALWVGINAYRDGISSREASLQQAANNGSPSNDA